MNKKKISNIILAIVFIISICYNIHEAIEAEQRIYY